MLEERLLPKVPDNLKLDGFEVELRRRRSFQCPAHCEHVRAVLSLDDFQLPGADPDVYSPDLSKFFDLIVPELTLRGLNTDRIATFKAKIEATNMLLLAIHRGLEDPSNWSSHRLPAFPQPVWSPEQQEVLKWVSDGLRISDAATMATSPRILQISGSPGTGKTEVVIGAARMALDSGCAVLIGGPIGLLVAMYKLRLPASELLTMETIHSAFKLTREADEAYIPPGRLRRYDVIILDEVSQIDVRAWRQLQTAFRELHPGPLILFVGDFQQLQPISGGPILQQDLQHEVDNARVAHVELKQHEMARSVEPVMLEFLHKIRLEQPSREDLEDFFANRIWPSDHVAATSKVMQFERDTGKRFMILTVTNKEAERFNQARLRLQFPSAVQRLANGGGLPADQGHVVIETGMRIRLTHNVNKEEGFVNGNTGTVRLVLRQDVYVMESPHHASILVYPITVKGRRYLPVTYGYSTTMRRAQGATLDAVGLRFDHRLPDRGYAYVGTSRAKSQACVFHIGTLRQTDWLPVGPEKPGDHVHLSVLSETTEEEEDRDADTSSQEQEQDSTSPDEPAVDDFASDVSSL